MTITAKVIADSVSADTVRLTTLELTYPRFIHAEFMTHRQFSRNASSSRAIPIEKMIKSVVDNPAEPIRWGANGKGMQDSGELDALATLAAREQWITGRNAAVEIARRMINTDHPPHKQIVNRLLEPFAHITVLVSATEFANFFALRVHTEAQPEIRWLAESMLEAINASQPKLVQHGEWHVPYVTDDDLDDIIKQAVHDATILNVSSLDDVGAMANALMCRISAARCARVSYLTHDKRRPNIEEDLALYARLMSAQPFHASPTEHQASPDRLVKYGMMSVVGWENPHYHGNFIGWQQFRKQHVGESVPSHDHIARIVSKRAPNIAQFVSEKKHG